MAFPRKRRRNSPKFWLIVAISLLLITIGTVAVVRGWYNYNLRPISSASSSQYFTVESGSSLHQIAVNLERANLIRSSRAFETYVRSNEYHNALQAGTYSLSQSMSVQSIVTKMVEGNVATNLLTILPAKRLDYVKGEFKDKGYSQADIDKAFRASRYNDHPALASLPQGASLEGYLYPDSYQKEANTPAGTIIEKSLDEMSKYLTQDIKKGFAAQGLTVHEGVILASIVLQEGDDPDIQPIIAQVFLTRLKQGMLLQSDPTAFYASEVAGKEKSLSIDSPYNTYLYEGLPPGPISNVTEDAMIAVAKPAKTDYLYFVAGDDGKVHFNHTKEQHEAATKKYCTELCGN